MALRLEYRYAECRYFLNVMLSVILLNVVMLNVVMLSVVAPMICLIKHNNKKRYMPKVKCKGTS